MHLWENAISVRNFLFHDPSMGNHSYFLTNAQRGGLGGGLPTKSFLLFSHLNSTTINYKFHI